ncbi:Six-hairpin glycosidase-like protein [Venturia nashicola]|nr:Six-hairpin glycosidase-like protein [Venturia nashicola]
MEKGACLGVSIVALQIQPRVSSSSSWMDPGPWGTSAHYIGSLESAHYIGTLVAPTHATLLCTSVPYLWIHAWMGSAIVVYTVLLAHPASFAIVWTCASHSLIDWYNPDTSVFASGAFPNGGLPQLDINSAAGDPASLGTAALLIGKTIPAYTSAATRQARHLLDVVPRWENGAISHREDVAELWSDSTFMVPPFLAYYGVATGNLTVMKDALRQGVLYRDVLGIPARENNSAAGLWKHIVGPQSADFGLWSTGNGWAAMGMMHVLAIAKHSGWEASLKPEISTLKSVVKDVLDAVIHVDKAEPDEPLLRNYLNDTTWFGELSGTSMLAATAYRAAELDSKTFGHEYVHWADEKRMAVEARINPETGLLAPVINPLGWGDRTPAVESPEGQSFGIMLFAAERSLKGRGTD